MNEGIYSVEENLYDIRKLLEEISQIKEQKSKFSSDDIYNRMGRLETHIINLIVPIQHINAVFRDRDHLALIKEALQQPIRIDDRNLAKLNSEFKDYIKEFDKRLEDLNKHMQRLSLLENSFPELKYIGNRLHKIEQEITSIKNNGVNSNVKVCVTMDGNQMVPDPERRVLAPQENEEEENILNLLNTLTEREKLVVIERIGLCGQEPKTYKKIGSIFRVSADRVSQIYRKSLRKLRHPQRLDLVMKIKHVSFRKEIGIDLNE